MLYVRSGFSVLMILSLLLAWTSGATAADDTSESKYEELLRRLNAQGQRIVEQDKKIAEQDKKIADLEADRKRASAEQDKKISEQDKKITELKTIELTPQQKQEFVNMYEEVKAQAEDKPILPKWLTDLDWFTDLRLRYHYETFSSSSKKDVSKGRFRLRVGAKKTWFEKQLEAGFRLASGSSDDPTSTNQSFDTNFSEKQVWIDRAYAKYKPKSIKGLEVVAGKMANPLVHTNIVWDSDLNPEGVWAVYKAPIKPIQPFAGAGYFQSDENSGSHNGTVAAYQGGVIVHLNEDTKWTTAGTYYDWSHYETTFDSTGGNSVNGGGTLLTAEEFDVVNVTTKFKTKVGKVPVSVWGDWAHNTENELDDGTEDAWGVGVKLGQNKKKGDLSAAYKYGYVEANASPGAFNDSDFGHSNSKGHQVGAAYSLADFMTVGVNLFYTEAITGAASDDPRFLALFDVILSWK